MATKTKAIDSLKCGGAKKGKKTGGMIFTKKKKPSKNYFAGSLVASELAAGTAAAGTAAVGTATGTVAATTAEASTAANALKIAGQVNEATGGGLAEVLRAPFQLGSEAITEKNKELARNIEENPTENPYETLRKMQRREVGGKALAHPLKTIVTLGLGSLVGRKNRLAEAREAEDEWKEGWNQDVIRQFRGSGYKEGGKIKGVGGPKSDKIKMKTKDGSFIVPAENHKAGMELGKTYLGWDDKTSAERNNGGSEISVSDGEILFTPAEVGVLKYHNVDLAALAPNAEPGHKMQEGGWKPYRMGKDNYVWSEESGIAYDQQGNEFRLNTEGKMELSTNKTPYGKSIFKEYSQPRKKSEEIKPGVFSDEKSRYEISFNKDQDRQRRKEDRLADKDTTESDKEEFKRKWYDFAPELAGALQLAGGALGLQQAGQKPDINVSRTLKQLSAETRRLAQFGYEPAVLNALDRQIEKARVDTTKAITGAGGSPMEIMAKLQNTLSTTIDKKAGLTFANAAEKARKWVDVMKIDTMKAGQEFDIQKINIDDWYKNQEVFAELLTAGISNIIGARQLKDEQDVLRKIGSTWPGYGKT